MAESTANIMLRIGSSLGPGGLSSLKAGLDMVRDFGGAILNAVSEADKFALAMQNVDMSIVNMADSAAAGQIDTGVLIKQMSMMKEAAAGVEVTAEQWRIMSARAAEFASVTGKDATEVFERMTNGIARAESEALKPFGIKLKENADMLVTVRQGISELTDGYEGFEFQAQTNTQRMKQLNNNWDTFKNLIFKTAGELPLVSSGLNAINEVLGGTNKALSETSESVRNYVFEFETWGDAILRLGEALHFTAKIMNMDLAGAAQYFNDFVKRGMIDPNLAKQHEMEMAARRAAAGEGLPSMADPFAGLEIRDIGGGSGGRKKKVGVGKGTIKTDMELAQITGGADYRTEFTGDVSSSGEEYERRLVAVQDIYATELEIERLKQEGMLAFKEGHMEREAYLDVMKTEEYQEQKLAEMREQDRVTRAEDNITRMYNREQSLNFAMEFKDTWMDALDGISAGAMLATDTMGMLKQSWTTVINTAIEGKKSVGEVVRAIVVETGRSIAIEAGWRALLEAAMAVAAGARRQYVKMTKHLTAMGMFSALAITAGAASAAANHIGGGSSRSSGGLSSGSSSFAPDYGGDYMSSRGGESREQVFRFVVDDRGLFNIVHEGNNRARRSGEPSFVIDSAA